MVVVDVFTETYGGFGWRHGACEINEMGWGGKVLSNQLSNYFSMRGEREFWVVGQFEIYSPCVGTPAMPILEHA